MTAASVNESISILLVEASDLDYRLARAAACTQGLDGGLERVSSAEQALGRLRAGGRRPQMILLDLGLPGMSGQQLLAELKADPELAGIPVVILCDSESRRDIEACYDGGAAAFMSKGPGLEGLEHNFAAIAAFWRARVHFKPEPDPASA